MRAAHYPAVRVRADMCNFPNVYEWKPTAHQRLMGSRWLLGDVSPTGDRGLVQKMVRSFISKRRTWTLKETGTFYERNIEVFQSFKSSVLSDFVRDEFAVFSYYSHNWYSIFSEWTTLTCNHLSFHHCSVAYEKGNFLPCYLKSAWCDLLPAHPDPQNLLREEKSHMSELQMWTLIGVKL